MNVSYTTRGFELTDQIKKYSEKKLKKIEHLDELIDVTLTMEHAKHLYKAELLVHNRNARLTASEQTSDVFKSINAVIDKMQKQIKRHKEKLRGRKRQGPAKITAVDRNMASATEPVRTARIIRARKQDVKPMSQDEAALQLNSSKDNFIIFRDTGSDRIRILFRRKDGNFGLVDSEI